MELMLREFSLEEVFKAAKAYQKKTPKLKGHTVRVKPDPLCSRYLILFEKVNGSGNNVGFEIAVPMWVI